MGGEKSSCCVVLWFVWQCPEGPAAWETLASSETILGRKEE